MLCFENFSDIQATIDLYFLYNCKCYLTDTCRRGLITLVDATVEYSFLFHATAANDLHAEMVNVFSLFQGMVSIFTLDAFQRETTVHTVSMFLAFMEIMVRIPLLLSRPFN